MSPRDAATDGRYVCTRCGNCCRWAGYVRVSAAEIDRIAAFLQQSVDQFQARFTRLTADRRGLSLIENADGSCCFLERGNVCRIHSVKPKQCRGFPNDWAFPGFERLCCAKDRGPRRCTEQTTGGHDADIIADITA